MRKTLLLILAFCLTGIAGVKAQCREYIESLAEAELDPYVLDGNLETTGSIACLKKKEVENGI